VRQLYPLHFSNIISKAKYENKRAFDKFEQTVDKNRWYMSAGEVNAYYAPSFNQIVFPAGILQPPFFYQGGGNFVNYGAIGAVIAHELTHGFDDQGRMYDGSGRLTHTGWMSAESIKAFNKTQQCFTKQYGNFEMYGMHVNGKLTLGENIADNGGLSGAFAAYQRHKSAFKDKRLPGMGLTSEQTFFLSFAQLWCRKARPDITKNQMLTDPHTPGKYRVIGTLQNSKAFSDAYQCKPKSVMNPDVKCKLW